MALYLDPVVLRGHHFWNPWGKERTCESTLKSKGIHQHMKVWEYQKSRAMEIIISYLKCNGCIRGLIIYSCKAPTYISHVVYFYALILANDHVNVQGQVKIILVKCWYWWSTYKKYMYCVSEHNMIQSFAEFSFSERCNIKYIINFESNMVHTIIYINWCVSYRHQEIKSFSIGKNDWLLCRISGKPETKC